jgi:CO/xanthine dehydrogenase FAD-binding subunit
MVKHDYLRPASIGEAIGLLQTHGNKAMLIAGGTDVIVGIRQKKFAPHVLVSLKGVQGFDSVEPDDNGVTIGALATHRTIAESASIRDAFSALNDAACHIGSLQIRNVATIGGNLSNGLPSADTACPLLVFNAQARIAGPGGERMLPLDQFFVGPGKTALRQDEILLELILPSLPPHSASCYKKVGRREAMEIAMLGIAMALTVDVKDAAPLRKALLSQAPLEKLYEALDQSEVYCREARLALGVAAPTPIRAKGAEAVLKDARLTIETLTEAGEIASKEAKPRDTMRGAAWFRTEMMRVLPKRLAITCLERMLLMGLASPPPAAEPPEPPPLARRAR